MSLCFIAHIYSLTFIINSIAPLTHHHSSEAVLVSIWYESLGKIVDSPLLFSASSFLFFQWQIFQITKETWATWTMTSMNSRIRIAINFTIRCRSRARQSLQSAKIVARSQHWTSNVLMRSFSRILKWTLMTFANERIKIKVNFCFCWEVLSFVLFIFFFCISTSGEHRAHVGLKLSFWISHMLFFYGYQSRQFPRCSQIQLCRQTTDRMLQQTFCNVLWIMHESSTPLFSRSSSYYCKSYVSYFMSLKISLIN